MSDVLPWMLAAGLDTGDVVDPSGTGTGDTNISEDCWYNTKGKTEDCFDQ